MIVCRVITVPISANVLIRVAVEYLHVRSYGTRERYDVRQFVTSLLEIGENVTPSGKILT
jgi:hypothetical protein